MLPLAIAFPDLSPVAVSIGPFDIRWYGLAYSAGIIIAWLTIRRLLQTPRLWADGKAPFAADVADNLVLYVIIGAVVGGRLGQALLYDLSFYAANPLEIFKAWKGGMSFHGALIGSGLAILFFANRCRRSALTAMDLCCAGMTLSMAIGRLANFANQEHWGRVTDVSWGMIFPNGGPLPRHPSQLYEAALEGLVMFVIIRYVTHSMLALQRPGFTAGVWLVWYGLARFFVEFFREPEAVHWLNIDPFTAGQFYCLPMVALGAYLIATAKAPSPHLRNEATAKP
jgi:phosphatidylglycerol---prolipoprotein diacylglyceryl transferase